MSKKGDSIWIYGKHPTCQILQNKQRKIYQILIAKQNLKEFDDFLQKNNLNPLKNKVQIANPGNFDIAIGKNRLHQGYAINCSRKEIKSENELLDSLSLDKETLLIIDQITDPHNIGAIIRSASAFGVDKIIFPENNFVKENAIIAKTSSGTIENVDFFMVTNLNKTMERLKKQGYWCAGLAGEGKNSLNDLKKYDKIALIIGSEGSGIRPLVKKNCDLLVKIPISNQVESLNASVACSIALYHLC